MKEEQWFRRDFFFLLGFHSFNHQTHPAGSSPVYCIVLFLSFFNNLAWPKVHGVPPIWHTERKKKKLLADWLTDDKKITKEPKKDFYRMLQQRAIHTPTRETKKNVRSNNVVHIKNPKILQSLLLLNCLQFFWLL